MEATVTYNKKEVCDIVLAINCNKFFAPNGMKWVAKMDYTDSVTCELVPQAKEDETP